MTTAAGSTPASSATAEVASALSAAQGTAGAGGAPAASGTSGDVAGAPAASATDAGAAGKATSAASPGELELKWPAGLQADEAAVGKFRAFAKELGLKADQAQRVLDMTAAAEKARQDAAEQQRESQLEALRADKEFGGANYDASLKVAGKAMARFGTPEFRKWLDESGAGNHPELVRVFVRIGKALGEDSVAGTAGPGGAAPKSEEHVLRALYPTMFSKE